MDLREGSGPTERGSAGFSDAYWRTLYGCVASMDGVVNADAHAAYLRSTFEVVRQPLDSVIDLGFGLGHMFEAVLAALCPRVAFGIEPSPSAFESVLHRRIAPRSTRLRVEQLDLASWCRRPPHPRHKVDLGICNSVVQYLSDEELELVVPVLAKRIRWLYFSVPTEEEYEQQHRDEGFEDPWAIARPRSVYVELLRPHFEVVGARLLESRVRVDRDQSPFTDDLFRGWATP